MKTKPLLGKQLAIAQGRLNNQTLAALNKIVMRRDGTLKHYLLGASLWSGEMFVFVHLNIGAHGFGSAALVILGCDDPIKTITFDGYTKKHCNDPYVVSCSLRSWITHELVMLATPNMNATGNPLSEITLGRIKDPTCTF